jgi:segregation and condensation protein B
MNEFYIRNVVEAALLAAGKPLQLAELGQLFDENRRPKVDDLRAALDALAAEYSNRGLEVKETAAGFRIQVRKEFSSEISRLWPERPARYSRALLETLALIAYRQPITRAEIEAVRGVAVNPNIVKTVIERNWVRVVGHRDVPGRPELLGTTREFLDYFGLRSLDELPPLSELKAMGDYNLQLELPNAGTLGLESKGGDGLDGEGSDGVGVAVAGLLTTEEAVTEVVGEGASGAEAAREVGGGGAAAENADSEVPDVVAAEANHANGEDSHVVASGAHHADDGHAVHAVAADAGDGNAFAGGASVGGDVDIDADAEVADRTLNEGAASKHKAAADSDEAGASGNVIVGESADTLDDAADDDADEDELSADGDSSRELVAAPRDLDD